MDLISLSSAVPPEKMVSDCVYQSGLDTGCQSGIKSRQNRTRFGVSVSSAGLLSRGSGAPDKLTRHSTVSCHSALTHTRPYQTPLPAVRGKADTLAGRNAGGYCSERQPFGGLQCDSGAWVHFKNLSTRV